MLGEKWHDRSDIDSLDLDIAPHLELLLSSVQLPPDLDLTNPEIGLGTLRTTESFEAKLEWAQRIATSLHATMQSSRFLRNTK